jgi:preprotein translocase subunit SecY
MARIISMMKLSVRSNSKMLRLGWVFVLYNIYIYIAHTPTPTINSNEMIDLFIMKIESVIVNIFKSYESPD